VDVTYWPEDWRRSLAEAFDAASRPEALEVRIVTVGNDGRYTGEVLRIRGDVRVIEHDATIAGQYAEGVTVRSAEDGREIAASGYQMDTSTKRAAEPPET
jgi:hypothetical protein